MSLFRSALRRDVVERSTLPMGWQQWVDALTVGDTRVSVGNAATIDTALGHPTVWRAVNKIAGMVVQMPQRAYSGTRLAPVQPRVLTDPSFGFQRRSAWRRAAVTSMLLKGGAYGLTDEVRRDGSAGRVDLIHPDRVSWTERDGWMIDNKPAPPEWPNGNFWQVPLMVLPGSPKGVNPLEYARRTTYAGMAASEFGGNFFRDGAHPTVVVQPDKDPGPEGARALKKAVVASTSGTDREPLVLPQSVQWKQIQINPEDSQFIELMQFTGGQVAGFFGLDPSHVGLPVEGGSMDYSNRENRQQDVLQDAVMQVVIPLDEAMTDLLPNSMTAITSPEGLLRADLLTRYQSYEISARVQRDTGLPIITNDEIRALENREPLNPADYLMDGEQ